VPYFIDAFNCVLVTSPSGSVPPGCRKVSSETAAGVGLVHGQQLTAQRADLLVEDRADEYFETLTEAERTAAPIVRFEPVRGPMTLDNDGLLLSTTPFLPGWEITHVLGVVVGNTVRTRNVFSRLGAGISATFGGELDAYTKLLTDSRNEAVQRMTRDARGLGANGIVGVCFNTSELLEIATELLVAGTAVKATKLALPPPPVAARQS
jgi:uncharacterized protein YbjQ (UPF0145 family)